MSGKLVVIVGSILIFGILENLFPFFTYKQGLINRMGTNFGLGVLNAIATSLTTVWLSKWLQEQTTWQGLFQGIQPVWLVGILSILILDLYMYFWHRLMHTWPLAWRFHSVHHTERSMNVSTAYRFHAVEVIVSYLPKILLIWFLGIAIQPLLIYELAFICVIVFHHSNWALGYGCDRFLSYFIVTPNYHRIHHSQIVEETNSNYASLLTIWDRIFQSFRHRNDPENIKLGLSEEAKEFNLITLLSLPF
ncbi:sterol desaturase family protein [Phormidium sp. LEGE 05292]|uniref:sterol desaturase family protein n=1 Tax=[Phormidium] sp. LEGE 05292 TaxID=767427 RepID=UPI0018808F11|nr:sterol desaturase family protein [Phormidium sp. LEGE 05292]MBE9227966.1 sterol desaturase family protein [Phormidium sp. LEGE 05292]